VSLTHVLRGKWITTSVQRDWSLLVPGFLWQPACVSRGVIAVVIVVGVGIVFFALVMAWGLHRAKRTYPKWIIPQLQKNGTVRLDIRNTAGTWNPAKPDVAGRVFASGQATYTLDQRGTVNLHVQPKKGTQHDYSGPLPDLHESPRTKKLFMVRRIVAATIVAALVAGFAIGFLVSSGGAGSRLAWGLLGVGVAWFVVWLGLLSVRVAHSIRSVQRDGQ